MKRNSSSPTELWDKFKAANDHFREARRLMRDVVSNVTVLKEFDENFELEIHDTDMFIVYQEMLRNLGPCPYVISEYQDSASSLDLV